MSKSLRADLDERARLNALLMKFFTMPLWTPAMGAQLVCGIQPVPNCDKIPDSACQLKNPQQPATPYQLHRARRVLERWVEDLEDEDDDEPPPLPSHLTPTEFVTWCEDSYDGSGPQFRPEWLDFTLTFFRGRSEWEPPMLAPIELVERALDLERVVAVRDAESSPDELASEPRRRSFRKLVLELDAVGKVKSPIAVQIGTAMDRAASPFKATVIWGLLCKVAREGKDQTLRATGDMSFEVPHGEGMRPYSMPRLSQYLRRLREVLGEGED
jgi:hypothetical protein